MDLSTTWTSVYTVTVTFVGTKPDGSTVQQSFTVGNTLGFKTYDFSGFNGVTSVTWYQHDPTDEVQWRNVNVTWTAPLDVTGADFGSTGPAGTAPVGSNDAYSTPEGTALTVAAPGVLGNDTDPNNRPLTAVLAAGPSNGAVTLNSDGSFSYTPATGFFGTDSFTYQAFDGQAYSDLATVTITVIAPPVANNDTYVAQENTTLTVSGLALSSGPVLRYLFDEASSGTAPAVDSGAAPAAGGTFMGAATRTADTPQSASTGALDLTAGLGYVSAGSVSKIENLSALTLTAWVNLRSLPANESVLMSDNPSGIPPAGDGGWELRITNPSSNTNPLSAANFGLQFYVYQSQGSYSNGQAVASAALNAADRWVFVAVTFDANHVLNYYVGDPTNAVAGAGSVTYSYGLSPNSAPFEIGSTASGLGVNRTPPAWLDDVRVYGSALSAAQLDGIRQEDLGRGVLANDFDPQGSPLTAVLVAKPAHGAITLNADGSFTYTPAAGFSGMDSFTYQASNGQTLSNVATVTLTVDQGPTANNDSYSTAENTTLSVTAPGVLGNDTDPNNAPLTAAVVTRPAHGSLTLNSNGSFTYTPTTGFLGVNSFTYQDSDGSFTSNVATVTLTVGQPPVAQGDTYAVNANASLAAGVGATFVMMDSQPGDYVGGGQTYAFTPSNSTITATVRSGGAYTNAVELDVSAAGQTWSLDFAAPNQARLTPGTYLNATRWPFQAAGVPGLAVAGDGRANNTLTGQFTVTQASYDSSGNLVAFAANFVQYGGGSTSGLFGQVAYQATATRPASVLANDTDLDPGTTLTANLVSNPSHGMVALNPDGSFLYIPAAGYTGTDSFTYQASDGYFQSNSATVTLNVVPPPTANNDTYNAIENTALAVAKPGVLGNDTDPSQSPMTPILVNGPSHGSLVLNGDGSFTYTPAASFLGADSFTYEVSDGMTVSNAATVSITVGLSAKATPIKSDTTTQGNWIGTYGAQGDDVINSSASLPSYATVTPSGQKSYTWTASTTDVRALQTAGGTGRIAACWNASSSFAVNVNLTDGAQHDLELYFLDWDSGTRAESVQISDATTGTVLSTQAISSFHNGIYLDYTVSGNILITITRTAGANAVLSGLFLDPAQAGGGASATFVKQDATTQGTWIGTYGVQGDDVINSSASLPSYATVTPSGQKSYTWTASTTDVRALQTAGGTGRIAACWYSAGSFTVDLDLTDGQKHDLELYFLDWDSGTRAESVQISDAATGAVLSNQAISSFHNGIYLDYAVSGNILITITRTAGVNALLNGLFLDPAQAGGGASAAFVKQDATTQGTWIGTYGAQGDDVIGNSASLPSYASVTPSGEKSYTWTASTTDVRALQTAGGTGRIAACWYSAGSFTVDLDLTDGQKHDLELYFLDWDSGTRAESVQISDAATGAVLSNQAISSFHNGIYLDYAVSGNILITITRTAGVNALLNGLFLDPATSGTTSLMGLTSTPSGGPSAVGASTDSPAAMMNPVGVSSIGGPASALASSSPGATSPAPRAVVAIGPFDGPTSRVSIPLATKGPRPNGDLLQAAASRFARRPLVLATQARLDGRGPRP